MILRFHVGSQNMQSKLHCKATIVIASYLITLTVENLLYLNLCPD